MQHMNLFYAVDLAPERSPVKALPMPVLQVNQNGEDEEHHRTGNNTLFVHSDENPRAAILATRRGKRHHKGK